MKKITGGVYFLYNQEELVYIGKSSNIFWRIGQHIHLKEKEFDSWEYQEVEDEKERSDLEGYLIQVFKPKYNEKIERNMIFDGRRKGIPRNKEDYVIKAYNELEKELKIPLKMLDDIFELENIGLDLLFNGIIPKNEIYEEYGRKYIKRDWFLKNINKLIENIEN